MHYEAITISLVITGHVTYSIGNAVNNIVITLYFDRRLANLRMMVYFLSLYSMNGDRVIYILHV